MLTLRPYINFIPKQRNPISCSLAHPTPVFTASTPFRILVHDIQFEMKAFLFPLAVLASSAMAQTTSTCGADYIVDACLESENTKLGNCKDTDYECKCTQWINIMTYGHPLSPWASHFCPVWCALANTCSSEHSCYNNCPNDPRQCESTSPIVPLVMCSACTNFPPSLRRRPARHLLRLREPVPLQQGHHRRRHADGDSDGRAEHPERQHQREGYVCHRGGQRHCHRHWRRCHQDQQRC